MGEPGPQARATRSSQHIAVLDGIRAVAVVMVMLLHLSYGYLPGGFLGVDLFFVLSGYLITRLLLKEYVESAHIRFDLFYLRRVYRLLPPIFLLLLLVELVSPFMPTAPTGNYSWWFSCLAVLFFFANFLFPHMGSLTHTWSLSVEEQFYFLWPVTLFLILKSTPRLSVRLGVPLALVIGSAGLRAYLESRGDFAISIYSFLFTRMDSLLLGAIAAILGETPAIRPVGVWLNRLRGPEIILLGTAVLLVFCDQYQPALYYGGFTVISFCFALLIIALVCRETKTILTTLLQSPAAIWIGKRSYGIYLYHYPIFPLLELLRTKHSVFNFVLVSALRLVVPLVIADISYRYIEMPFLRRKGSLKWNAPKASGAAQPAVGVKVGKISPGFGEISSD